jgi:hypothetical protein
MDEYRIEVWNKVDIHCDPVLKIALIVGAVTIACGCGVAGSIAGRNGLETG